VGGVENRFSKKKKKKIQKKYKKKYIKKTGMNLMCINLFSVEYSLLKRTAGKQILKNKNGS
jgi:hypothetical protein